MKKTYDTVLTVRVDRRDLATAELIFRKNGYIAANKSDLVRAGLEALVKTYVENGEVKYVHSTEEAIHTLSRYGSLNVGGKGQRTLSVNLKKEVSQDDWDTQVQRGLDIVDAQQDRIAKEGEFDPAEYERREAAKAERLRQLDAAEALMAEQEEEKVSFDDV